MAAMKELLLELMYDLSDETGYDVEFLLERYGEIGDFHQVVAIAKNHGWQGGSK